MALLHELAGTYLTACDVEGKARSTIRGYRESLTRLQETGARLDFPAEVDAFTVQHVYAFLGTPGIAFEEATLSPDEFVPRGSLGPPAR